MLPATVSLTDGVTPEVFGNRRDTPNGAILLSSSPQSDLLGAPTLRVETSTTSKQIERSLLQIQRPIWNADLKKYVYFTSWSLTYNRSVEYSIVEAEKEAKKLLSLPLAVLTAMITRQI